MLSGESVYDGVVRWWGTTTLEVVHRSREPVRWAVRSTEQSRGSWRRERGRRMARVAHPRGGAHGHGDSFGNSPQRRCFVDASEPARAWGRGAAYGATRPGVRGAVAWHASGGSKWSRGTLSGSSSVREMRGATRRSELHFGLQVIEVIRVVTSVGARALQVAGCRQRWREVAGGDQATEVSPRARGRVLAGTRCHGSLASGPCH
jgi:hypothetical protein